MKSSKARLAPRSKKRSPPDLSKNLKVYYSLSDNILFRIINDSCSLLDLNSGKLLRAEGPSAVLLLSLDGSRNLSETIKLISSLFGFSGPNMNAKFFEIVTHFIDLNLIHKVSKSTKSLNRHKPILPSLKKIKTFEFKKIAFELSSDILVSAGSGAGGGAGGGAGSSCCGS